MPDVSLASDPLEGSAYRSKSLLGKGAMGEVLLAEHRALGKEVVIKVVHAALARPELAERMRVEAQILANLRHPGIVQVNDLGQTSAGRPFMVMERLVGRTLSEEIASRGALPTAEAIDIICELLAALVVAHAAGVVHRDIKPDNVFVHQRPHTARVIKLLDFGVAKILAGGSGPLPSQFPTEEGAVMGTPRFCSPEQALGKPNVDHRADIYGVGALLYFVLTGRKLFAECSHIIELLRAHAEAPPPRPSSVVPVSATIDAIVSKALAKDPADRFQSAAEMIGALRRAQRERPPPVAATASISEDVTIATALPAPLPVVVATPTAKQEIRPIEESAFDRFRFALVFCVTMVVGGAALIAVLRWLL
ncbi:MAG: serine/threonine protein kinase [Polyangiaceae bacterium]|nr:serine/threonine protein kinase [Polyangiaceae bacterium]